ncbi:general substrate transporter [Penicillium chermesinum]|nr:general substrate transporter [Penicillium chermesinum]
MSNSAELEKTVSPFENEQECDRSELAAQYAAFEESLTVYQTLRLYWRSILWVMYGLALVFGFGIDGNVAANLLAMPRFRVDYGKELDSGGCWLADRIGRKYTALISCVISIGGVAAQFASHGSLGVLAAGKAINGIPTGMWLVIGPLIPLACQWIVPGLIILTAVFWPESPVWLVRMGKPEAAMKAIKQLYGSDKGRIDGEAVLAQIEETIERERRLSADKASYIECFAKGNRQNTLMSMFVYACQYLSGVVLVQGYQSYMYELLGYSSHEALLLGLLNIALQWIANVCSWFLIPTIGPRNLIVWGQLLAAISLFIIGGACTGSTQAANQVAVGFMFIWGVIYQLSVGAASWTVVGELPVLRLRSKTQALSNATLQFFQWLIGFVFPYMFNPDAGNLGGKVAFVFGGTTMVGFLVTFLFLPELRNPYKK